MQTNLAARYARALADVVSEPAALEKIGAELASVARVVGESKPLRDFVLNPAFPFSGKVEALDSLARKLRLSGPTLRLLQLLLQKGRLGLLREVSGEFRKIEEKTLNRVSVEFTTALPLEAAQLKRVVASFEKFTGKTVRLDPKVDAQVLGGARARVGSLVYDGTVAGALQKLKERLIGER